MSSEKNLCQLEKENPRPRKVVAELTVKKETLQEVVAANYDACSRTRDDRLCVWCVWRVDPQGLSHHSTCRATYHHQSRRPEQALLRKRIRERAETHVRYGYRRITVLLKREGWHVSVKRVHRPYSLDCLQMRLTPPRRRVPAPRRPQQCDGTQPGLGDGLEA